MFSNTIRVWYVAKVLRIMAYDSKSKFEYGVYISDARQLKMGSNVRINENVFFQGSINIGSDVMIAPNVSIYTVSHEFKDLNMPMVDQGNTPSKPVTLEDDVWIGRNVIILPGVTIGKGTIVGANSVVNKDLNGFSIYGGVPAKLISKRSDTDS